MPSQRLIDEIQAICYRNRVMLRRAELFKADPTCHVCTAAIEHVEDCGPVKMATGEEFLVHNACSMMMYQEMATRFFAKARPRGFGSGLV